MEDIGFTDEELRRLNSMPEQPKQGTGGQVRGQIGGQKKKQSSSLSKGRRQQPPPSSAGLVVGSVPGDGRANTKTTERTSQLTPEAAHEAAPEVAPVELPAAVEEKVGAALSPPTPTGPGTAGPIENGPGDVEARNAAVDDVNPFTSDGPPPPQLSKIETLQLRQVTLERENRERQRALATTLSERFNRTAEQAKLLRAMQEEVAAVERELSCDISLLRDRIDQCNMRYSDARKRHEEAEKEYIASKLELHQCAEQKEGLEEHLFTIITLNETRKSEKLEQLHQKMQQLQEHS